MATGRARERPRGEQNLEARAAHRIEQRSRLLSVARRHFFASGYFSTSLSAIASEIGGSKGILWSLFATKQELFVAVIDEETRDYHRAALALLDEHGDPLEIIGRFAACFIARMTSRDAVILTRLIGSVSGYMAIGDLVYARLIGIVEAALMQFYARHIARGALDFDDPAAAASLTIALCAGTAQFRLLWTDASVEREEIEAHATAVAAALAKFCRSDAPRQDV